jgi:hypothetical protein
MKGYDALTGAFGLASLTTVPAMDREHDGVSCGFGHCVDVGGYGRTDRSGSNHGRRSNEAAQT